MRIYNGTKSVINLPLTESQRITVAGHSVSGDIMPNTEFLSLLVGSYDYSELALIISGPYEINMCSQVSGAAGFVVQSLEEAIERFTPKEDLKKKEKIDVIIPKEDKKKPAATDKKDSVLEEISKEVNKQ